MSTTIASPLTPFQLTGAESEQWRKIVSQQMADVRTAIPAFLVEDLGAQSPQTVTVQPAVQEFAVMVVGQAPVWVDIPPIINVPIVTPRGGGYSLTLPLKKGDEGLLVFSYACFDLWWQNGESNAPKAANVATPSGSQQQLERRRHHVHDCFFIPGAYSQPNVLGNYSTNSLQIRSDDGATVIDVAEGGVTVTAPTITETASAAVNVTTPLMTVGGNVLITGTDGNLTVTGVITGTISGGGF